MPVQRIQNDLAESVLTPFAFGLIALCLWRPWQMWHPDDVAATLLAVAPLLVVGITAYVLLEWGARWQVIRIRTRLTTSLFVLGTGVMSPLFTVSSAATALAAVLLLFSLSSLNDTHEAVVPAFHAAVSISVISLVFPQLLWLWLVMLFCMVFILRALTPRTLSAIILGGIMPWFFFLCWVLWRDNGQSLIPFGERVVCLCREPKALLPLVMPSQPLYAPLDEPTLTCAVIAVVGAISILHFYSTRYNDKIRTRILFYTVQMLWLATLCIVVLTPHLRVALLPALWLLTCPWLSHHLALSHTRLTTFWLFVIFLAFVAGVLWLNHLLPL